MNLMNKPYWIVLFRIFTAVLYYLIVVPLVFVLLFVPVAVFGSPLVVYLGEWIPFLGAAAGAGILAERFRQRRKGRA